jgi:hypothetical protein
MKNKIEKALEIFVDEPQEEVDEKKKIESVKKVVLDEREGLIERVDRIYVTKDGKQLLREVY